MQKLKCEWPMLVEIGSEITITNPSDELVSYVCDNLWVENPEYVSRQKMGKYLGNTCRFLNLYRQDMNTLTVPYGFDIDGHGICYSRIHARTAYNGEIKFDGKIDLYDYQEPAVEAMLKRRCGILESPCGTGKTVMIMAMIQRLGRKALFLCHTKDLLKQAYDTAHRFFPDALLGVISEGKVNIGEITFATIQTMSKLDLAYYRYKFDVIFVDEAHRVAGSVTNITMYSRVLSSLAACRKYGVTATPFRNDSLFKATQLYLGKVCYQVSRASIKTIKPQIIVRHTGVDIGEDCIDCDGTLIHHQVINNLCENAERNNLILSDLKLSFDHHNLILSDRVEHLKYLRDVLGDGIVVIGSTPKKEREQALQDTRDGKVKYLFSTYQLAREGLDIPVLDRLYLVTPKKDKGSIIQSVGRIVRPCAGKRDAIVYDYVDQSLYTEILYKTRRRHYNFVL